MEKEIIKEELIECEKCGDEILIKWVRDEIINYCKECNWVTY